jgi:hypothetical protein
MSSSGETLGAKPLSLHERTANATAAHIREELGPVIKAMEDNQEEIQSCVRQTSLLLDMQRQPWRKAGIMLWGMVVGVLLFAFLQPRVKHANNACALGSEILTQWSTLSASERAVIEKIVD